MGQDLLKKVVKMELSRQLQAANGPAAKSDLETHQVQSHSEVPSSGIAGQLLSHSRLAHVCSNNSCYTFQPEC